ncbi:glycosyltransferase family 2 protein [Thermodesulfobacteriota bacterium]
MSEPVTDGAEGGLTIIIPAYNEIECLERVVEDTIDLARRTFDRFEVIIVDDGSTDGTFELSERLGAGNSDVRVIHHGKRMGSGGAILSGIRNATGEMVMYVPADGQFHLEEIHDFIDAMEGVDIVIGARLSRSDYSAFRRISSIGFITIVNTLFRQRFKDVNWVHMWRLEIFDRVRPRSTGVFLLEEILVRAMRAGYGVREIDSVYKPRIGGASKVARVGSIMRTLWDIIKLWIEINILYRDQG